jgi:hypothetical protein
VHILRLATVIGILERYLMESLNPDLVDEKELPYDINSKKGEIK